VIVVVAVVGAGMFALWPGRPSADARPTRAAPPGSVADTATWRGRVLALDAARSAVFARGDPARLREVYAAGSPAAVADAAAVAALTTVGAVAPGVRHEVLRVRVLAATPSRARLELTDRMPGYRVLDRRGRVLRTVPPRPARTFRVDLVASASGWRIAAVGAAGPGTLSAVPTPATSPSGEPRPGRGGGT
jgi:hypothetical protein